MMNLFKDIFILLVRLTGLLFLYNGLVEISPLFNSGVLDLSIRTGIWSTILPILFKLGLAFWFLSNSWLARLAYPQRQRLEKQAPNAGHPATQAQLSPDQKLARLVAVSLLMVAFCGDVKAGTFSWEVHSDIHAAAPASHYGSWNSPNTTTSNDWYQSTAWTPAHTNDGVLNVSGEIYPGDLYEQNLDPSTLLTVSNLFLNPNVTTNWVNPMDVFSYISNQIQKGMFEFACNGNHDADDTNTTRFYENTTFCGSNAQWNIWLGTNVFGRSEYFESTRFPNDTRQMCMLYTNGPLKFVVCSMAWCTNPIVINPNTSPPLIDIIDSYTNQVYWVKSKFDQYPDHLGVLVSHWALNYNGQFDNQDCGPYGEGTYTNIGPSQAAAAILPQCNNFFLWIAGHNRATLSTHQVLPIPGRPGYPALVVNWDTQAFSPFTQMFDLLTFCSDNMTLYVNAYDISQSRFLTNGETRVVWPGNSLTTEGSAVPFYYSYQFPIPNLSGGNVAAFKLSL